MSLYFRDTFKSKIDTTLDFWTADAALVDLGSDSFEKGTKLKFVYEVSSRKPEFLISIKRKSLLEMPTEGQVFWNTIPEVRGQIVETGTGSEIRLQIRNSTGSAIFLWFFHFFGILFLAASIYSIFPNGIEKSWPFICGGILFAVVPILLTNHSMASYNKEIYEDLERQIRSKERTILSRRGK